MNVLIRDILVKSVFSIIAITLLTTSNSYAAKPTAPGKSKESPGKNKNGSDTTAPTVSITSQPNNYININSASFSFSASDRDSGVSRAECSINGLTFATCTSPMGYSNLIEGEYNFSVRAIDNVGLISAVASASFNVDLTKPVITFTQTPAASSTSTSARYAFSITDASPILAQSCSMDGAAYVTCASPMSFNGLAVGSHTFRVRAQDMAGNVEVAAHSFTIEAPTPTPSPTGRYSLDDATRGLPFVVDTPAPPQITAEQVVTPTTIGNHINTPGMRLILEAGNYGNRTFNSQDQQIILREGVVFGSVWIGGSARRISIRNEVPRSGNMTNISMPEGGRNGFPEDILIDGVRSDAGANVNFIHGQRIAIINSFIRTVDFPLSSFNAPPTGYNDIIIANCYLENYGGTLGEAIHPEQAGVRFHNTNRFVFVDNRVNKIGGTKHVFRLHGGDGSDIDYAYVGRNIFGNTQSVSFHPQGTGTPVTDIFRNIWFEDNHLSSLINYGSGFVQVPDSPGPIEMMYVRGNTFRGQGNKVFGSGSTNPGYQAAEWVVENNSIGAYADPPAWEFK